MLLLCSIGRNVQIILDLFLGNPDIHSILDNPFLVLWRDRLVNGVHQQFPVLVLVLPQYTIAHSWHNRNPIAIVQSSEFRVSTTVFFAVIIGGGEIRQKHQQCQRTLLGIDPILGSVIMVLFVKFPR